MQHQQHEFFSVLFINDVRQKRQMKNELKLHDN